MSDNIRTDSIDLICTKDDFVELMDDNAKLCKRVAELEADNERLRAARENWYCESCGCQRCLAAEDASDFDDDY